MVGKQATVERAYEIARYGSCQSVAELKRQLETERYPSVGLYLSGPSTAVELQELIDARLMSA